jgi:hypothetical protein
MKLEGGNERLWQAHSLTFPQARHWEVREGIKKASRAGLSLSFESINLAQENFIPWWSGLFVRSL